VYGTSIISEQRGMLVTTGAFKRRSALAVRTRPLLLALIAAVPARALAGPADAPPNTEPAPSPPPAHPTVVTKTPPASTEPAIIITGSRIPRTNLTAVSPVSVVSNKEIKLQGTTNIEELLNRLPQVAPSQGEYVSNGSLGTATVDLRGLGAQRTLVLIDGHRVMPGDPRVSEADINIVPASLIQRVEVLTGGAAAVYGSDAVAGVVNFIMDTKLEGIRVDGEINFTQHDNRNTEDQRVLAAAGITFPRGSVADGRRETLDVTWGRSFFDGRANLMIYGGYRHITELRQDSRDYSACTLVVDRRTRSILQCGGSDVSFPGNFFDNLGNEYVATDDRAFVPGGTVYNYGPWNFFQRPDDRYTAGGFANFDVTDAFRPYAEVMYMNDRTVAQIAPSGDFGNTETINCDNPLLSDQQRALICTPGNFVGEESGGPPTQFVDPVTGKDYLRGWLAIARRNVEGGPRQDDMQHKSIRMLGGVKGDLGRGVSYDASYLYGKVVLNRQYLNDLSITKLTRAVDVITDPATGQPVCRSVLTGEDPNCVPWDVFAPGQVTPAATNYLSVVSSMHGSFKEQIGNANATAELDQWGIKSPWSEESPAINLGGEFRKDSGNYEPDELAQNGDIAGFGFIEFPVRGTIDVKELFGEVRIPLVTDRFIRRLAFEGGYRRSWYNNGDSSFSATAYKLALDFIPINGLRVRASQQRAVRAPNIQELFTPIQLGFFDNDPCAGPTPDATQAECALTGVTAAQYGHVLKANDTLFGYNYLYGGNTDLQPEVARTRTIGLVVQPRFLPRFNATVDWWDIQLQGAIEEIGPDNIMGTCLATGDPTFCNRIHRDPNGSLWLGGGHIDDRQANIGALKVRGIDIGTDYSQHLGRFGSADFNFHGSYLLHWIVDNGGLSEPYDCTGLYGDPCFMPVPRWKHTAKATWTSPIGTTVSFGWRYTAAMKLGALDPRFGLSRFVTPLEHKIPAVSFFDLATAFTVQKRYELRLGVNNIFDREPPRILGNTPGADGPLNGNTYPGWYDWLGRYIFASFTMNLPSPL
jgi:outer membrane receptor protein involved in Fe transport